MQYSPIFLNYNTSYFHLLFIQLVTIVIFSTMVHGLKRDGWGKDEITMDAKSATMDLEMDNEMQLDREDRGTGKQSSNVDMIIFVGKC